MSIVSILSGKDYPKLPEFAADLETGVTQMIEKEITPIKQSISELRSKDQELESKISNLEQRIQAVSDAVVSLGGSISSLSGTVSNLSGTVSNLGNTVGTLSNTTTTTAAPTGGSGGAITTTTTSGPLFYNTRISIQDPNVTFSDGSTRLVATIRGEGNALESSPITSTSGTVRYIIGRQVTYSLTNISPLAELVNWVRTNVDGTRTTLSSNPTHTETITDQAFIISAVFREKVGSIITTTTTTQSPYVTAFILDPALFLGGVYTTVANIVKSGSAVDNTTGITRYRVGGELTLSLTNINPAARFKQWIRYNPDFTTTVLSTNPQYTISSVPNDSRQLNISAEFDPI